jgi:hypothetical protein
MKEVHYHIHRSLYSNSIALPYCLYHNVKIRLGWYLSEFLEQVK